MPFRIVTRAGQNVDVYQPDLLLVGRGALMIGTGSSENPTQFELATRVAILRVTALQDLPLPTPPDGNGQQ